MLKIGEFSKLSRISVRMLRHYDELGLLTPQRIDSFTGYRYYTAEQLVTAGRIRSLREMGFGLAAIGEVLRCCDTPQALAKRLACQRAALQDEADALARQMLLLDTAMEQLRKDETAMKYDITVKTLPERQVASVRMVLPRYEEEGRLWNTLMTETAGMDLAAGGPCAACAILHDKEYKEQDVDVEVQMTVRGHWPDTEHVRFKTERPVEVASVTFRGGYDQLTAVYAAMAAWVQGNGYAFDGPMFNIYHVSPHETSDPNAFVTEACCPVRRI